MFIKMSVLYKLFYIKIKVSNLTLRFQDWIDRIYEEFT